MRIDRSPLADWPGAPSPVGRFSWPLEHSPLVYAQLSKNRAVTFSKNQRELIVQELLLQNKPETAPLIQKLLLDTSVTVTTGQQIGLGMGPLYTVIKIAETLALAKELQQTLGIFVVPIFWMATEDHDFDEANRVVHGHRVAFYNSSRKRASVGSLPSQEAIPAIDKLKQWAHRPEEQRILEEWSTIYNQSETLSDAMRALVYRLFSPEELVVLDANRPALKASFQPILRQEWKESVIHRTPLIHTERSVDPKKFNAFVWKNGMRLPTEEVEESEQWVESAPEKFSPGVLLRPMYQEYILPNVGYIGGASEWAYWMQIIDAFAAFGLPLPVFKLRSSVSWLSPTGSRALRHSPGNLLEILHKGVSDATLLQRAVEESTRTEWSEWESDFNKAFTQLEGAAHRLNPASLAMVGAWRAQHEKFEKRWKAQAKRYAAHRLIAPEKRIKIIQDELMPSGMLQERKWSTLWPETHWGPLFAQSLIHHLDPWKSEHLLFVHDD